MIKKLFFPVVLLILSVNLLPAQEVPAQYASMIQVRAGDVWLKSQGQRDGFIFWTDTHVKSNGKNAPALMNVILSEAKNPKVFFGGDCMPARDADIATPYGIQKQLCDQILPAAKVFCLRGNHDFYYRDRDDIQKGKTLSREETSALLEAEMRGYFVKNPSDRGGNYFYYDEPSAGIRYVAFDTNDYSISIDEPMYTFEGVGQQQLDWIFNEAVAGAPANFSFVFLMHVPVAFPYKPMHWQLIDRIDKLAGTGRLLAVFTGHNHHDFQVFRNGTFWISTASDAYYSDANRTPYTVRNARPRKETLNEQAFDYVSIKANTINCTRVGYGSDRIYHLDKIELKTGKTARIVSTLGKDASWFIYDAATPKFIRDSKYSGHWELTNKVAKISPKDGTITPLSDGEAVVVAVAADTSKIEVFPINVTETKSTVPDHYIILGDETLLGDFGFGAGASTPVSDYYSRIEAYARRYSPDCKAERFLFKYDSKLNAFKLLTKKLKVYAPKAPAYLVAGWYNNGSQLTNLKKAAEKAGLGFIQIDDLKTDTTKVSIGDPIYLGEVRDFTISNFVKLKEKKFTGRYHILDVSFIVNGKVHECELQCLSYSQRSNFLDFTSDRTIVFDPAESSHPNDLAHQRIADRFIESFFKK